jgi:hypothetical protein
MMYRNIMKRLSFVALAAFFVLTTGSSAFGQTSVQNFGTGTGSQTSQTGTTAFLPNPTSGTTWARAGAVAPNAPIVLSNTSNPLGTTGSYVRGVASSSTSVSKFSPMVGYTGSTEFYTSFKVLFGNSTAGNTATSGSWNFYQGAGAMYSDASDFAGAQVFTGLRFTYGAGGTVALTYRGGAVFTNTGLTTSTFNQATVYTVEIVGNNKTSGTINYTYNGVSQSVAVQKFDLYINGTLIGDDLAEALLPANTNINSNTFIGISSTSNVANVFVDDVVTYNAVPATIGTAPTMPGAFSLSSATYGVGEGDGNATVTVNRTGGSDGVVTITVNTSDGTATGGAACGGAVDYQSASNPTNVLMFNNGETSKTFNIPICDDAAVEGSETFNVALSTPTGGATLGSPSSAMVTITDNDVAPAGTIQFNSTTYSVGEAGGNATLTVTRMGGSNGAISATYSFADITATGGSTCAGAADYDNDGGSVMFGDGDTTDKTISVPICSDAVDESDETFSATLSGANVGTPSSATVTITDDDTAGVTFTETGGSTDIAEGGATDTYSVVLNSQPTGDVTITPSPDAQVTVNPTSLTFTPANWNIAQSVTVTAVDDSDVEGNHTGLISHTSASSDTNYNGLSIGSVTANITDNDMAQPGTAEFSMANYTVAENTPGLATITVVRTGGSDGTLEVNYATSNGTASGGAPGSCSLSEVSKTSKSVSNLGVVTPDYENTNGTLTFVDGDTSETFNVPICDDNIYEGDETVNLTLSPVSQTLGGAQTTAVLTIIDNETQPTLSIDNPSVTEPDAGSVNMNFTVTLSSASTQSVTVDLQTSDGTATSVSGPGQDYVTTSGSLFFSPGETSKLIQVPVLGDTTPEPDETFSVTLSNPSNATISSGTGTGTIIDNDTPPPTASVQFSAATYEYDEGDDEATITVTRTGETTSAVTVDYATSNGTANGGSCQTVGYDYQTKTGTLSFAAGETSKTFSFEVCSDTFSENPAETVNLTLSNPTGGATIGSPNPVTLRIIDAATQFVNSNPIFIPELQPLRTLAPSVTASASVVVSGAGTSPNRVRVTLFGFTHPTPDDLDILLVSPTGQKFVLLGDAGGTNAANNVTLTFEDAAITPAPDATALLSGNYKPANHEAGPTFDAPAPGGPYFEPGPTGTAATLNSTFSANPNGTWTLYLRDDTVNGNTGVLAGGFGLEFIAPTAAGVNISGRVTRPNGQGLGGMLVSLVGGGAGSRKYAITSSFGYYTFENVIVGETYILSVSSKRYTFSPSNLIIDLQDGVTDANFVSQQ